MKDFVILSMIAQKLSASQIAIKANCKIAKVEAMQQDFNKGFELDSKMLKMYSENMK